MSVSPLESLGRFLGLGWHVSYNMHIKTSYLLTWNMVVLLNIHRGGVEAGETAAGKYLKHYAECPTIHESIEFFSWIVYMLFNHSYDGWLLLPGIRQVLMSCRFVNQSKQWSKLLT